MRAVAVAVMGGEAKTTVIKHEEVKMRAPKHSRLLCHLAAEHRQ